MRWLCLILLNISMFVVCAQDVMTLDAVQDSVNIQLAFFPQEKIHLHTDRDIYVPGEKIWFKVYVVDALSHHSQTYSQYAYVELINSSNSLIQRVMVSRDEFDMFHGNIFLSEMIPDGDYTLRAYTRYLENLGDDYFFYKHIRISNLNEESMQARRQSRMSNDFDVSFFPEGGYLTDGVVCKVAFKALNKSGVSEVITGKIVDENERTIVEVNTVYAGMGLFSIETEAGKTYFLVCKNQSGQEKRFKLPGAQKTYTLEVGQRNNRFLVGIKKSPELPEQPLYLLVHCRGLILYYNLWNHQNSFIPLNCDQLPSGIIQITLFDGAMNPLSERLIYNKNDDQAQLIFASDKPSYQKREYVNAEIYMTDSDGNPLSGHLSVAITDDSDVAVDMLHTIQSSLLLSSELKGTIESPGYYLQENVQAAYALDLLMMTNGWRRYDISEAIKGNYMRPEIKFEVIKEISGLAKKIFLGGSVENSEILVYSSEGDYSIVETDATGSFRFGVHYPDSVTFFIQALNRKGRRHVELMLNREQFPALKYAPKSVLESSFGFDKSNQTAADMSDFIKKAEQRAQYDDDMRLIQLPEIVVSAKRVEKKDEARLSMWMNSGSDATIYREDIEKRNPHKVIDVLRMFPGVQITTDGSISIRGGDDPVILINGMFYEGTLDDLNIQEVETVDLFKGPSAAIFGTRGANGVISITTRRGTFIPEGNDINYTTYAPIGFQKPVEFYSPKYDTPAAKNLGLPDFRSTIFWKPNVLVSADGSASFDFYTSDFPATYSVVIEGLSKDGRIIRQVETIEVK